MRWRRVRRSICASAPHSRDSSRCDYSDTSADSTSSSMCSATVHVSSPRSDSCATEKSAGESSSPSRSGPSDSTSHTTEVSRTGGRERGGRKGRLRHARKRMSLTSRVPTPLLLLLLCRIPPVTAEFTWCRTRLFDRWSCLVLFESIVDDGTAVITDVATRQTRKTSVQQQGRTAVRRTRSAGRRGRRASSAHRARACEEGERQ